MTLIKNLSVYMTVSISVERYVAIFYPLVYKVMMVMVAMMVVMVMYMAICLSLSLFVIDCDGDGDGDGLNDGVCARREAKAGLVEARASPGTSSQFSSSASSSMFPPFSAARLVTSLSRALEQM